MLLGPYNSPPFLLLYNLQVSVAVLLDKFITATVDMESEERQQEIEEIKKKEEVHNSPFPVSGSRFGL